MSRDPVGEGDASKSIETKKDPPPLESVPSVPVATSSLSSGTKPLAHQQKEVPKSLHAYDVEALGYEPDMTQNNLVSGQ